VTRNNSFLPFFCQSQLAHRPDITRPERAREQSGTDQARLEGLQDAYTAIWWYPRRRRIRCALRDPLQRRSRRAGGRAHGAPVVVIAAVGIKERNRILIAGREIEP